MSLKIIGAVVGTLVLLTVTYKLLPYRRPGDKKPWIALLPKYQTTISLALSIGELTSKLSALGFSPAGSRNGYWYFNRGSILGDFSVKILKVRLGVQKPRTGESKITLEASWVLAFDTGDLWTFTNELANQIDAAEG